MKKLRYTGSPGFSVTGIGSLVPDDVYEVEDDELAKALAERDDFEEVGGKKAPAKKEADK